MATPQADEQAGTGNAGSSVLSRYPAAIALGGGVAAAFGSSFIPMNAIEGFVTAYGIAELLPAAAPPLGDTARLALSAGIGTLTAGALLALLPRAESDDMGFETAIRKADDARKDDGQGIAPAAKSGKLAGWLRTLRFGKAEAAPGTITDFSDLAPVRIRNGDQHPDAPVRAPIRASEDLGEPLDAPEAAMPVIAPPPLELGSDMAFAAPAVDAPAPSLRFAPPPPNAPAMSAPEEPEPLAFEPEPARLAASDPLPLDEPVLDEVPISLDETNEMIAPDLPVPTASEEPLAVADVAGDLDGLSTAELLARLEAGLARRRAATARRPAFGSVEDASARVFSLAKPALPTVERAEFPAEDPAPPAPFKLRLDEPQAVTPEAPEDDSAPMPLATDSAEPAPAGEAFGARPIWDEDVEYLPPSVSGYAPETAEPAASAPADMPEPAPAAQDDDMDAALRDALATLRQLSDKQRGG
ncbi:hypothetical protein [Blastomonas sp. SL216]|uniref:hypothetical protein n=1 Tax=Blastomonas sp. SL216 TaxID=2995169 RepID=UPI0023770C3E|nr:hypothetical protein OU999_05810 [Blastomonas sp. SL216]